MDVRPPLAAVTMEGEGRLVRPHLTHLDSRRVAWQSLNSGISQCPNPRQGIFAGRLDRSERKTLPVNVAVRLCHAGRLQCRADAGESERSCWQPDSGGVEECIPYRRGSVGGTSLTG